MSDDKKTAVCALCGEPMPPGEEVFKYHGFSGPCPKPPLQKSVTVNGPTMKTAISDMADAIAERGARIRDLQQQLKTAREEERERCAKWHEARADLVRSRAAESFTYRKKLIAEVRFHKASAAAIRSLGEKE